MNFCMSYLGITVEIMENKKKLKFPLKGGLSNNSRS